MQVHRCATKICYKNIKRSKNQKKSFNMKLLIISIYDYTCYYKLLKSKQVCRSIRCSGADLNQ